jgi:Neuraminidase (sialidase)
MMEEKPKSLRRNLLEHFDTSSIKGHLDNALKDPNRDFEDNFLSDDNKTLVRDILSWAGEM